MMHKVLSHGAGSGDPFRYLLKERTTPAEVLLGDVELCRAVIRGVPYRQRYTSAVLTFSELLEHEQERKVIADYEAMAFGGYAEEFARVWIAHREHARTELHIVIANIHLLSGKRWAHYFDRVDRRLFKAWQEITNIEYGFSSPDDPQRRRLADHPGRLPAERRALFVRLDEIVCDALAGGEIAGREDIVRLLEQQGYKVHAARRHLAVQSPDMNQPLRLRGKKYEASFSLPRLIATSESRTKEQETTRLAEFAAVFEEARIRRRGYVEHIRTPRRKKYENRSGSPAYFPIIDQKRHETVTKPVNCIRPTRSRADFPGELRSGASGPSQRTHGQGGVAGQLCGGRRFLEAIRRLWAAFHRRNWTFNLYVSVGRLDTGDLRRGGRPSLFPGRWRLRRHRFAIARGPTCARSEHAPVLGGLP